MNLKDNDESFDALPGQIDTAQKNKACDSFLTAFSGLNPKAQEHVILKFKKLMLPYTKLKS